MRDMEEEGDRGEGLGRFRRRTAAKTERLLKKVGISRLILEPVEEFLEAADDFDERFWESDPELVAYLTKLKYNRLYFHELTTMIIISLCLHLHPFLLVCKRTRFRWYEINRLDELVHVQDSVEAVVCANQEYYDNLYAIEYNRNRRNRNR